MPSDVCLIPVAWLREQFSYDPETGNIYRKQGASKLRPLPAGTIRKDDGYRVMKITFGGRRIQVMCHRLAWALHHGEHPEAEVDHKDCDRLNNRAKNLRLGNRSQQNANKPKVGALPKGVCRSRSKSKPFKAQISVDGVNRHLGHFSCPQAAHEKYMEEARVAFGDFARAS